MELTVRVFVGVNSYGMALLEQPKNSLFCRELDRCPALHKNAFSLKRFMGDPLGSDAVYEWNGQMTAISSVVGKYSYVGEWKKLSFEDQLRGVIHV